ncbi:carboxymuconolactone decarboxylase family protein [Rhodococcus sp. NPDC060176]|uniref:carboxymuconolactone decarboxylase family protein n=1 Tax=Rhodococcus sp. NPDC060176 TaxID=3347062 RepID=UPI00366820EB
MGQALAAFNATVFTAEGQIPRKYREPMAVAVALTTQCEGCIKVHTHDAVAVGATDEELAETTYIAASLRAGGAVVYGLKSLAAADKTRNS